MAETWNKRERELKKKNAKKQKDEKKLERKENSSKGKGLDDMLAYVDEYGNLSASPPPIKKATTIDDIPPTVANSRELNDQENSLRKGIVTFFNTEKGYGFIKDIASQESIFVHINSSAVELKENLKVTFETQKGPKGLTAVNVNTGE